MSENLAENKYTFDLEILAKLPRPCLMIIANNLPINYISLIMISDKFKFYAPIIKVHNDLIKFSFDNIFQIDEFAFNRYIKLRIDCPDFNVENALNYAVYSNNIWVAKTIVNSTDYTLKIDQRFIPHSNNADMFKFIIKNTKHNYDEGISMMPTVKINSYNINTFIYISMISIFCPNILEFIFNEDSSFKELFAHMIKSSIYIISDNIEYFNFINDHGIVDWNFAEYGIEHGYENFISKIETPPDKFIGWPEKANDIINKYLPDYYAKYVERNKKRIAKVNAWWDNFEKRFNEKQLN